VKRRNRPPAEPEIDLRDAQPDELDNPFSIGSVGPPIATGAGRAGRPLGRDPLPGPRDLGGGLDLAAVEAPGTTSPRPAPARRRGPGFAPERQRSQPEALVVWIVAAVGVVALATALGAVLGAAGVAAWVVALASSALTLALVAVLWRTRLL